MHRSHPTQFSKEAARVVVPFAPRPNAPDAPQQGALAATLKALGLEALVGSEIHPRLATRLAEIPEEWVATSATSTRDARRSDLRRLAKWCAGKGIAALADEAALARAVQDFLREAPEWLGAASLARAGSHLAGFLTSLGLTSEAVSAGHRRRMVVRAKNRAARERQTEKKEGKRWLSAEELGQLEASIELAPITPAARARDRAIFVLMTQLLLRRNDIENFRLIDWDPEAGTLTIRHAKNDQEGVGVVYRLQEKARACLEEWLFVSGLGEIEDAEARAVTPIFTMLHKNGGLRRQKGVLRPLTGRSVSRLLTNHGRRAGISGVSGHTPRRSVARLMHEAGYTDEEIQQTGRWDTVEVMRGYVGLSRAQDSAGDFLMSLGI